MDATSALTLLLRQLPEILERIGEVHGESVQVKLQLEQCTSLSRELLAEDHRRAEHLVTLIRTLSPYLNKQEKKQLLTTAHLILRDSGGFLNAMVRD